MANLTLLEWDGLCELITVDLSRWSLGKLRFCNAARGWSEDGEGVEEPTDILDYEFVTWDGEDFLVVPFKTQGWRRGGDGVERPKIELVDINAVILNQLRAIGGAKMAPVSHFYVLAEDLTADTGEIVGVAQDYMINKVTGNGVATVVELGTHADTTRTSFPPSRMSERDFPGLRNRYDRS